MRVSAIDWGLARATGVRLASKGPNTTREDASAAVAMLRDLAREAVEPVRETSMLDAQDAPPAIVVDRPAWIESNIDGFQVALAPALAKVELEAGTLTREVGSRITALELGAMLGWLSGKVLGQFEAFRPAGEPGRLLLVAPNIVSAQRALGVDERDFAMWVCLHEETHRVQFGAVPWLADHLLSEIHSLIETTDMGAVEMVKRLGSAVVALGQVLRGDQEASILEAAQTPEQRVIFDRITAVMSLLEGHADVIMDEVGPAVVPSVAVIRERFDRRRREVGQFDGTLRRILGFDAKMRQYSDGASFTRGVMERVGTEGFNQVWAEPANLPSRKEIADPAAWVRRVHLRSS